MQEQQLIERFRAGESSVFKEIFERHKDRVINICHRLVGNQEEAEDLCQEVFFKVYKSLKTFKSRSKFSTWVYRIAVNQSLNHLRKKKQFRRMSPNPSDNHNNFNECDKMVAPFREQPDLFLEQKEREQIVWRAVESLPKNQRVALILQKYEGFSCQQIAEILDCTLSSVQSRLHRAKENLYKKLLPYLEHM